MRCRLGCRIVQLSDQRRKRKMFFTLYFATHTTHRFISSRSEAASMLRTLRGIGACVWKESDGYAADWLENFPAN